MNTTRLLKLLSFLLTATFILTAGSAAASPSSQGLYFPETPDTLLSPATEAYWVVRAYYADRQMVNQLAQWLEPWEVHHDQGYLVVGVTQAEFNLMQTLGFRLEIDQNLTDMVNSPRVVSPDQVNGIPGYPCYRTVEETFASAQALVTAHPELATWIDIGDSWDKVFTAGQAGYDLRVLRLTNAQVPGPKPKLFVMASVHAREYTPAELTTRFAEYLASNYDQDPDVTWILNHHEIHLLLQANPDGRKYAEMGYSWRKNTNQNYCFPTSTNRGADLNRNFEFQWGCCGGSSGSQCSETYRGPTSASEPETQAIQQYVRNEFPDQRGDALADPAPDTATGVFLDLHSYSELVLWPWGFTYDPAPNSQALQTLGRKFAFFNQYTPEQSSELYFTDGATDDFAYGDLGLAAYTFELGTYFFQSCNYFENNIWPQNLPALLYAAKVARTPYLSPAGPDALSISLTSDQVGIGEAVQLTATVDDTRYLMSEPTQNIVAAEYYIDNPPWVTNPIPLPYSMAALDGSFNNTIEIVTAAIDTSNMNTGRHILFIRGQDADGNWGPPTAYFILIQHKSFLPMIANP